MWLALIGTAFTIYVLYVVGICFAAGGNYRLLALLVLPFVLPKHMIDSWRLAEPLFTKGDWQTLREVIIDNKL